MVKNENKFVGLFSLPADTLPIFRYSDIPIFRYSEKTKISPVSNHKIMGFGDAAYSLENVLLPHETKHLRQLFESNPQIPVDLHGKISEKTNAIGSYRSSFYSEELASILWDRILSVVPISRVINEYSSTDNFGHLVWEPVGINPLFRMIGYRDGGYLLPHYDSGYDFEDEQHYTLMSILLYLDPVETYGEGQTRFLIDAQRYLPAQYRDYSDWNNPARDSQILYGHNAKEGSALIFDHRLLHEATPSMKQRIVLRTDLIFKCLDLHSEINSISKNQILPLHKTLGVLLGVTTEEADQAALSKPHENLFSWKVLRDPIYARAYETLGNVDDLLRAGFLDHDLVLDDITKKNQAEDPRYLVTPLHKIERRLNFFNSSGHDVETPFVVLVTTGGFCPIHHGHVEMMEIAKKTLELRGMFVLGGYISPSHSVYVDQKCGEQSLTAHKRLSLCEEFISGHEWLMVDPWESMCNAREVNFTEVILRLGKYLCTNLACHRPIRICYVFGSDNAGFSLAFTGMSHGICVPRQGYEQQFHEMMNHPLVSSSPNMIFAFTDQKTSNISSSELREKLKHDIEKSLKLFIRDEGTWSLSHWTGLVHLKTLEIAQKEFVQSLLALLTKHCIKAGMSIDIDSESLCRQKEVARSILHNKNVISLDPCLPGDFQFEISRSFEIGSRSGYSECVARPGAPPIDLQIQSIPDGKFVLFDDDMATQSTMKFAMNAMPERIQIDDYMTLRKADLSAQNSNSKQDCADVRDFLVGSHESGLVVKLPGGKLARAPYILPYVYPSARVSLPIEEDNAFSLAIWRLNHEFFKSLNQDILVKNAAPAFRDLAYFIGFDNNDLLASVCQWHINKLNVNNINQEIDHV